MKMVYYILNGVLYFEGYLNNGYREGYGVEYDLEDNVIFEGLYKEGMRNKRIRIEGDYMIEYDEEGNRIIGYKVNDKCEKNGICYLYKDNKVCEVWKYDNNEKVCILINFEGNEMNEYNENGGVIYRGRYIESNKYRYIRNGFGTEYDDDGNKIYEGEWKNGKRHGEGKRYRNRNVVYDGIWWIGHGFDCILLISMIVMIASIIISFVCLWWVGIIILVVDIFFYKKIKVCYNSTFNHNILLIWIFVVNIFNIIFICVLLSLILPRKIQALCIGKDKILIEIIRTCGGWASEESFDIYQGSSSTDSLFHQGGCSAMTANLCINPVVHTIVMKDSARDGWSGGSRVTLRYKDQRYIFSGPFGSSGSETFHFVGFSYFLLIVV